MSTHAPRVAALLSRVLGDALMGVYAYGSSVAGSLRHQSDLDLLVVVSQPLSAAARSDLVAGLLPMSGWNALDAASRPLDVTVLVRDDVMPWRYPPLRALQFGEWLRADLAASRIAPPSPSPDLAILLTTARQHSWALLGPPAASLLPPVPATDLRRAVLDCMPSLLDNLRGDERNVLLTLARMWVTAATGEIVSKDQAAQWVRERLPRRLGDVLALARAGYLGEQQDEWVTNRPAVDAFVARTVAEIRSAR
jgi:predicted nucleotidyltransferase